MICIVCKKDKPIELFNEEHIFPRSIGGTLTLNSVCEECNSYLGHSVDSSLVNHVLVQLTRLALRIPNEAGEIPNPLQDGDLKDRPDQKVRFETDASGKPKDLYIVPNKRQVKKEDGWEEIELIVGERDKDKIPSIINKILRRKGLPELPEEEIRKHIIVESLSDLEMRVPMQVDLFRYHRGVLKIAYELAHYWIGPSYINDPIGEALRLFLLDRSLTGDSQKSYSFKPQIEPLGRGFWFPFWSDEPYSHIALMRSGQETITCYIRVFNLFKAIVMVSESASSYPLFLEKFVAINPQTGETRERDLDIELLRVSL